MVITKSLSDAEIKALPTTPIQLIPAPGAGKVIVPINAFVSITPWVANYTNINANAQLYMADPAENFNITTVLKQSNGNGVGNTLAWGEASVGLINQKQIVSGVTLVSNSGWNLADGENQPLMLFAANGGSGNFTGGDPGNVLKVTVSYMIVTT
jgi:hypothetical protein